MTEEKAAPRKAFLGKVKTSFVTGFVLILPLFITLWLLKIVIGFLRSLLHGTFHQLVKLAVGPDLASSPYFNYFETLLLFAIGLPIVLLLIVFVGWLAKQYIGQRLFKFGEKMLVRLPLIGGVYDSVRKLVDTVFMKGGKAYRSVVLVEFPRKGMWMLGFVTSTSKGEVQQKTAEHVVSVFVPTTPNPTSGFLVFVPESEIVALEMSVEDGIKLVISGGVVEPVQPASALQGAAGGERPVGPGL